MVSRCILEKLFHEQESSSNCRAMPGKLMCLFTWLLCTMASATGNEDVRVPSQWSSNADPQRNDGASEWGAINTYTHKMLPDTRAHTIPRPRLHNVMDAGNAGRAPGMALCRVLGTGMNVRFAACLVGEHLYHVPGGREGMREIVGDRCKHDYTMVCNSHSAPIMRPRPGVLMPHFGPSWSTPGPTLVEVGQIRHSFGRNRPHLVDFGPIMAQFGKMWSGRPEFGRTRSKLAAIGQMWPTIGQHRPKRTDVGRARPIRRIAPKAGQHRTKIGRARPTAWRSTESGAGGGRAVINHTHVLAKLCA